MFLDRFPQIKSVEILAIEWNDDPFSYDEALYSLGKGLDYFVCMNPTADCKDLYYINEIPDTDKCIVWHNGKTWLAKFFYKGWKAYKGYKEIRIQPTEMVWRWNPDIDKLMQFEENIFENFEPLPWDRHSKMVWYMDKRFNPLDDKVWAFSCQPIGKQNLDIKDMGTVTPQVDVEYNRDLPVFDLDIDSMMPAYWELRDICAYRLDPDYETDQELWVVKITPAYRQVKSWNWLGQITPNFHYTYNPNLPRLRLEIDAGFKWYDLFYEHVWYLDRQFLVEGQDDVWLVKVKATSQVLGDKHRDYIKPILSIIQNPDLGPITFKIDPDIRFHDLGYRHIWYLDQRHCGEITEPIWAVKLDYCLKPVGDKHIDYISPEVKIKINPNLKNLNFTYNIDHIPYYDFLYRHIVYLDNSMQPEYDMWFIEITYTKDSKGDKTLDSILPDYQIEYNSAVTNLKFTTDYVIPYHDRNYLHMWYVRQNDELIWLARCSIAKKTTGEKTVAVVEPILPDHLDVVFISYNEPNAESNWQRVLEIAPWAKRVHGVKGIFQAHRQAAKQSETDMFYVVDGDAYIVDSFDFNFQPGIFDRKFTYIWLSENPFNGLQYGYGGVKLFNRNNLLQTKKWTTLDMTTTIHPQVKIIDKVSNLTLFNTDRFATWRSAVREVIKLHYNIINDPNNQEHQQRLQTWRTDCRKNAKFVEFFKDGIRFADEYFAANSKNLSNLTKINDFDWLRSVFNKRIINIS